ncbi:chorismate-binding protein [Enterococcus cecorum]
MQHIFLTLTGQRQEKSRFLEVIENLHPTPALGGNPKEATLLTYKQMKTWIADCMAHQLVFIGCLKIVVNLS